MASNRELDLSAIVATYYPDALVQVGDFPRPIPASAALAFEAESCKFHGQGSVQERARFLFGLIADGGTPLLLEHQQYLAP